MLITPTVGYVDLLDYAGNFFEPTAFQLTGVDGTRYVIDEIKGLLKITDPNGNSISRTAGGYVHSNGRRIDFERDTAGRVTAMTDPEGKRLTYEYDAEGRLIKTTDRAGSALLFSWLGTTSLLQDIRAPRLVNPTHNAWDGLNRLQSVVDQLGHYAKFGYDLNYSRLRFDVARTDALDRTTTETVDMLGRVTAVTNALGHTTRYSYDDPNNPFLSTSETDPQDRTIHTTYTPAGLPLTVTDARGHSTRYTYGPLGRPLTVTDALGYVTRYEYDVKGNSTRVTDAAGGVTTSTYDARGNRTAWENGDV